MEYRVNHPWPVGGVVIPAGTVITGDHAFVKGLIPPPDVVPLDKRTRDLLVMHYPSFAIAPVEDE